MWGGRKAHCIKCLERGHILRQQSQGDRYFGNSGSIWHVFLINSEPQVTYRSLQILRAVAAWMVVYHHFMQIYFDFKYDSVLGYFFSDHGSFGVDLFFVLSGFVMYFSVKRPGQTAAGFIVDRIFRIVPVYWFYTFLIITCIYLFPIEFDYTGINASSILASLLFIPHSNPSGIGIFPTLTVGWTLNFEMFFYLFLAACLLINRKFAIVICFAVLFILPDVYPKEIAFSPVASSYRLHEFLMGLLIASLFSVQTKQEKISLVMRMMLILALGFIATAIALLTHESGTTRTALAGIFVCLTLLFEPIARRRHVITDFLTRLGDKSYSTYLVHTLIIGIFLHFTGTLSDQYVILLTLAAISATVHLASSATYSGIERSQYVSRLKTRFSAATLLRQ